MTLKEQTQLEELLATLGEEYIPTRYQIERSRLRMWSKIEEHKRTSVRHLASSVLQRVLSGLVSFVFVFVLFATFLIGSKNNSLAEDLGELHIDQGDVYITRSSQRFKAIPGERIKKNDIIEVSSTSSAHVTFSEQKTISLADNSKIKVRRSTELADGNITFDIEKGSVVTTVEKDTKTNFIVHTPEKIITVTDGAGLAIAIDPDTKVESLQIDKDKTTILAKDIDETNEEIILLSSTSIKNKITKDKPLEKDVYTESIVTKKPLTIAQKTVVEQPNIQMNIYEEVSSKKLLSYLVVARVKLRGVVEAISSGDMERAEELSQSYFGTTGRIAQELNVVSKKRENTSFLDEYTQVAANLSMSTLDEYYNALPSNTENERQLKRQMEDLHAIESSAILHAELSTIIEMPGLYVKSPGASVLKGNEFVRHVENQVVARLDDVKKISDQTQRSQALVDMLDRIPNESRNYEVVESMYEHVPEEMKGYVRVKMYEIKGKELRLKTRAGSGQLLQE